MKIRYFERFPFILIRYFSVYYGHNLFGNKFLRTSVMYVTNKTETPGWITYQTQFRKCETFF